MWSVPSFTVMNLVCVGLTEADRMGEGGGIISQSMHSQYDILIVGKTVVSVVCIANVFWHDQVMCRIQLQKFLCVNYSVNRLFKC